MNAQVTDILALVDAAHEVLGRDVIFQIERVEQELLSSRSLPHHAVRPTLADKATLPTAWGGIGRFLPFHRAPWCDC